MYNLYKISCSIKRTNSKPGSNGSGIISIFV